MRARKLLTGGMAAYLALVSPSLLPAAETAPDDFTLVQKLNEAFVQVAEKVSPTVVVISVVQRTPTNDNDENNDAYGDLPPGFWKRFHDQFKRPDKMRGEGSGVIIRSNGYILTNRHVVEDAESIEVRLHDGRNFKATVRGQDPQSDLAVLKIEASDLPSARFADFSKVRVGEFAIAVGAPFSLDYSVSYGHVSAKGRSSVIDGPEGAAMDQDFLQTDALINPGNSGGPLVNIYGEIIGINTLIRGLHTGIGFAIPSNLARDISDQLVENGRFTRAWLGIGIQALRDAPELREFVKGIDDGVVVSAIMPEGPAAKSDLHPSDIITSVDGVKVATAQQLRMSVRSKPLGTPVVLDVYRSGKMMQVKLTPGEWVQPSSPPIVKAKNTTPPKNENTNIGVTVQELTKDLAKRFGVNPDDKEGVLISAVDKNSLAAARGLKAGDIITSINQQAVNSKKQFDAALKKVDPQKGVLMNVISDNTPRFLILRLDP